LVRLSRVASFGEPQALLVVSGRASSTGQEVTVVITPPPRPKREIHDHIGAGGDEVEELAS